MTAIAIVCVVCLSGVVLAFVAAAAFVVVRLVPYAIPALRAVATLRAAEVADVEAHAKRELAEAERDTNALARGTVADGPTYPDAEVEAAIAIMDGLRAEAARVTRLPRGPDRESAFLALQIKLRENERAAAIYEWARENGRVAA